MGEERWLPVAGWEGLYEVSDRGRVRNARTGLVLKPGLNGYAYPQVALCRPGKRRQAQVHHLVAEAFIGPRPAGCVVHHKNHDAEDARAENLEYVTRRQNTRHAILARWDRVTAGVAGRLERHPELQALLPGVVAAIAGRILLCPAPGVFRPTKRLCGDIPGFEELRQLLDESELWALARKELYEREGADR